jgi:hypothetical protein
LAGGAPQAATASTNAPTPIIFVVTFPRFSTGGGFARIAFVVKPGAPVETFSTPTVNYSALWALFAFLIRHWLWRAGRIYRRLRQPSVRAR